jgi:hypothetical protein
VAIISRCSIWSARTFTIGYTKPAFQLVQSRRLSERQVVLVFGVVSQIFCNGIVILLRLRAVATEVSEVCEVEGDSRRGCLGAGFRCDEDDDSEAGVGSI